MVFGKSKYVARAVHRAIPSFLKKYWHVKTIMLIFLAKKSFKNVLTYSRLYVNIYTVD